MDGRYRQLERMRRLDPDRDHHEIYRTSALIEFPWDTLMGLNLAFYRTFAVPGIASLLASTGEMTRRTRKRADDTGLLMLEMIEHGLDHERGRAAVRRLNQIHRRFDIPDDEYRYVLGCFMVVPVRWLDRYGWRPLCCHERRASFVFYRELGRLMGITGIPDSYPAMAEFFDDFEAHRLGGSDAGRQLMAATASLFRARVPRLLGGLAVPMSGALLDDQVRRALELKPAPWTARVVMRAGLRIRGTVVRRMLRPRTVSKFHDRIRTASYPDGYDIPALGPPPAGPSSLPIEVSLMRERR
jgi:hypothetical protein